MRNVYLLHLTANALGVRRLAMPLGPLIVASAIRRSPGFGRDDRVVICDTFREVLAQAGRHEGDRVHFLASSAQIVRGVNAGTNSTIAGWKRLKHRHPKIFSCVGGPDVSLNREDYLAHFDLVYQGEIGAVDPLEVIRSGERFFQAPPAEMNAEPLDYGLLAGRRYLSGSIQTSRGCPHDCSFCNIGHIFGRSRRTLDPRIFEERLEALAEVHRGFVIIADDSFGSGIEGKVKEYLDVIIRFQERRGYPFIFAIQTSLRTARSAEVLRMMRDAHIVAAFIGVESPSEEALTAAHKRFNLGPPLHEQIGAFVANGIFPYPSLILGLDGEPADIGLRIRKLLDACGTPFMLLNLINPIIGSRFRARAAAENRLLDHPIYFKHNLMSLKTGRPYTEIVRDYGDILDWFYEGRRILGDCDRLAEKTRNARNPRAQAAFVDRISASTMLKLVAIYAVFCVRSGTWPGLLHLFRMIGRRKSDVLDFLVIRGVALGAKRAMKSEVRLVRRGMAKLEKAGLYPFGEPAA